MTRLYQCLGHHSIVRQYRVLNECLHMIGQTSIRTVDKIRIETKLIRLQSLLLASGVPLPACTRPGEEDPFDALLHELRMLPPRTREDHEALNAFRARLRSLLTGMGGDPLPG